MKSSIITTIVALIVSSYAFAGGTNHNHDNHNNHNHNNHSNHNHDNNHNDHNSHNGHNHGDHNNHGNHGDHGAILAESTVATGAVAAMEEFKHEYEAASGQAFAPNFIGFNATSEEDEVEVGIYTTNGADQATKSLLGCHFHFLADGTIEETHCHDENVVSNFPYSFKNPTYNVEEFETSLVESLEYFEKRIGEVSTITGLKMWQVNKTIELKLTYELTETSGSKDLYMMCHYHHGTMMDCHKHRRPGPNQPMD
jgi:hypothetical protein